MHSVFTMYERCLPAFIRIFIYLAERIVMRGMNKLFLLDSYL